VEELEWGPRSLNVAIPAWIQRGENCETPGPGGLEKTRGVMEHKMNYQAERTLERNAGPPVLPACTGKAFFGRKGDPGKNKLQPLTKQMYLWGEDSLLEGRGSNRQKAINRLSSRGEREARATTRYATGGKRRTRGNRCKSRAFLVEIKQNRTKGHSDDQNR